MTSSACHSLLRYRQTTALEVVVLGLDVEACGGACQCNRSPGASPRQREKERFLLNLRFRDSTTPSDIDFGEVGSLPYGVLVALD